MVFKEAEETVRACRRLNPHARIFMVRNVERGHPDWGFVFLVSLGAGAVLRLHKFNREFAYAIKPAMVERGSYAYCHMSRSAAEADDWDVEVFPELERSEEDGHGLG